MMAEETSGQYQGDAEFVASAEPPTRGRKDQQQKLSQEELLVLLNPPPFRQEKRVPPGSKIVTSCEHRWWRSDSPDREGCPDVPRDPVDVRKSGTRGVLGYGNRQGPGCYQSQYQTGSGTAAHFKDESHIKNTPGYSGFIAGKYAGNIVGGTYMKSNEDASSHLQTTAQALRFGTLAQAGHLSLQ